MGLELESEVLFILKAQMDLCPRFHQIYLLFATNN